MKRLNTIVSWMVELGILAGLLWKLLGLYDLTVAFLLLVLLLLLLLSLPVLALMHWIRWIPFRINDLGQRVQLRLLLLTGPSLILSAFLILGLSMELKKIAILRGGATKEMAAMAWKQGVPNENFQQWHKDHVERMKSERLIYAMLLASTCILYGNRYSSGRLGEGQGPPKEHG
jgi:hypothetical protein